MAAARAEFKEKNPDYKSAFRPKPTPKENFPNIERTPAPAVGRSAEEISKAVQAAFPSTQAPVTLPNDAILDFTVSKEDWVAFSKFAQEKLACDYLIDLTAVDWLTHFDVVAQLLSLGEGHKVFVRCSLPRPENPNELPEISSLTAIYPAAEWKEREVYDMFGISFENHPDLRRIFTEDGFEGWPLRKDFEHPYTIKKTTG
ncbi:MAG: NADH-quinone oxidoreductase subunit C [Fibromonadaceae bacterium]|nr:NADH-quinone oxidoreductase subunit C [Fibromonadaceae bacterium]